MSFSITILGSSGAMPAYGRHPTAQLIEIQYRYFLVDCGEGTQMQLMRYQLPLLRINHILISHLHGDHYLGLMGLIFSMHLHHRINDLHLYSHRGLEDIILIQLKASASVLRFKLIFHQLEKNKQAIIFEDDALTVETLPLNHKIICSGFLFKEKLKPRRIDKTKLPSGLLLQEIVNLKKGDDVSDEQGNIRYKNSDLTFSPRKSRSYAYCSDTAFHEPILKVINNVDLLYHEATFTEDDVDKAEETKHSTAKQAATLANQAGVSKLLIGHFSARYKDLTPLLVEAKTIFPNVELALEGENFSIQD